MTLRLVLQWIQRGLLVHGVLLLALWFKVYAESRSYQSTESRKLQAAVHEAEQAATTAATNSTALVVRPDVGLIKHGREQGTIGKIGIPRLRIAAVVAEGSDARTLARAVGHVPSRQLPAVAAEVNVR